MDSSTFGQHCLSAFVQAVPASCAAFYRIDSTLEARDFLLWSMPGPMHKAYLEHYRHLDPLRPGHCDVHGAKVIPLREGMAKTFAWIEKQCLLRRCADSGSSGLPA